MSCSVQGSWFRVRGLGGGSQNIEVPFWRVRVIRTIVLCCLSWGLIYYGNYDLGRSEKHNGNCNIMS